MMSSPLKRKASFSAMAPPNMTPVVADPSVAMDVDDTPHLNSRTRKRFRDDRPDEKTVYGELRDLQCIGNQWQILTREENTLRLLYTAQQRQASTPSMEINDDNSNNENENENSDSAEQESRPSPETIDPRQQTLLKFFKPTKSSCPSGSSQGTSQRPSARITAETNGFAQPFSSQMSSPIGSMGVEDTRSPSSGTTGTDMDIEMSD